MLDSIDSRLLAALQQDAHLTAQDLSDRLNLSASQIGRRRQRLEAEGYIQGYVARLDAPRLGLSVQGFVQVHLSTHGPEHSASFARLLDTRPEITSAWAMTGDADYLLRFVNEQGKILPRRITGITAKQQRQLTRAIKRARHMALIPFVSDTVR